MTTRDRRIENEWNFLLRLQGANPDLIQGAHRAKARGGDWFHFVLQATGALASQVSGATLTSHCLKFHFPEFFPAVPIEAYLATPVVHPNIDPESGFICLWDRFSPGDSVIEAVAQSQRVISWELFNRDADHLMQPEALNPVPSGIPLPYAPVNIPADLRAERHYARPPAHRRTRLS